MNTNLQDLIAQRDQIEKEIGALQEAHKAQALAEVKKLISEYDIQPGDIFPSDKKRASRGASQKLEPKYKDPQTGKTWSGRGLPPAWIRGQDYTKFAI